jgi:hypothetical protein
MGADLVEIIEHLSRHEGGALGASRIVFDTSATGGRPLRTGMSVDDFLTRLRGVAQGAEDPAIAVHLGNGAVTVTSADGQVVGLVKVLGFGPETFAVFIESRDVTA